MTETLPSKPVPASVMVGALAGAAIGTAVAGPVGALVKAEDPIGVQTQPAKQPAPKL